MAVNKIEIALKEALKKAMIKCNFVEDYEIDQITIEIPKEKSHGDYSTNIAMQLTRLLRKNPRMIAEELIEAIDKKEANIDSIEIAGPGFINMFMKKDALTSIIKEVLEEKENYLRHRHWMKVRKAYLEKKNMYLSRQELNNHSSYNCYIEAINEVYNKVSSKD